EPGTARLSPAGRPPAQEAPEPPSALLLHRSLGNSSAIGGDHSTPRPALDPMVAAPPTTQATLHGPERDPFAPFLSLPGPRPRREPAGLDGTLPTTAASGNASSDPSAGGGAGPVQSQPLHSNPDRGPGGNVAAGSVLGGRQAPPSS